MTTLTAENYRDHQRRPIPRKKKLMVVLFNDHYPTHNNNGNGHSSAGWCMVEQRYTFHAETQSMPPLVEACSSWCENGASAAVFVVAFRCFDLQQRATDENGCLKILKVVFTQWK